MSFVRDLYVQNNLEVTNNCSIIGNTVITGNLEVTGTTTAIDTTHLNIADNHVYLNKNYTTATGLAGGIVVNYLPTGVFTTVAGGGFTSTTELVTAGADLFLGGDIIQITGTVGENENRGLFQVASHIATALIIEPATDFCQSSFTVSAATGGTITKVNVGIARVNSTGVWETVIGSNTGNLTTKSILLDGDSATNQFITVTNETNQIAMGTTGVITLSALGGTDATITIQDTSGVNDTFAYTTLAQTLSNKTLTAPKINDTSSDHTYTFAVSELLADRIVTLPLLGGNDEFTFNSHAATLLNKTLTLPGINDTSSNNEYKFAVNELTGDRTITLPLLGGNDEFTFNDHMATLTNKTLTAPKINDTSSDHTYTFAVSELVADRTITLPILIGNDEFTFNSHISTLSNKTLASPVVTGTVLVPAGTVGAPSYSFTNDTNAGMFHDGADSVNIVYDGATVLSVAATGITVAGSINADNVIETVKAYTGAGAHVLATDGRRVNTISHTSAAAVSLPGTPTQGTKYTVINISTGTVNINRTGGDTIDNAATTTIALSVQYQRVTLQYVGTIWYIV
jgi:hypothetical protein